MLIHNFTSVLLEDHCLDVLALNIMYEPNGPLKSDAVFDQFSPWLNSYSSWCDRDFISASKTMSTWWRGCWTAHLHSWWPIRPVKCTHAYLRYRSALAPKSIHCTWKHCPHSAEWLYRVFSNVESTLGKCTPSSGHPIRASPRRLYLQASRTPH